MVSYARNDITRIHLGHADHPHERPLLDPADPDKGYVPVWGINCGVCEPGLDPTMWSKSRFRIPLTPDEQLEAEDAKALAEQAAQRMQRELALAALNAQSASGQSSGPEPVITGPAVTKAAPEVTGAPSTGLRRGDLQALTKNDLKDLARGRGLSVGGTRDELIARLAG